MKSTDINITTLSEDIRQIANPSGGEKLDMLRFCKDHPSPILFRDKKPILDISQDEFVGILPETREQGATIVAERIRGIVNTLKFLPNPDKAVYMTVSVGVAEYMPGEEKEAFVKRADMNMYVSKSKV